MNFKKISKFVLTGCIASISIFKMVAFAVDPCHTVELSPDAKIYINRNGGISHNTYVIEESGCKFFSKNVKKNYLCLILLKGL